MKATRRFLDTIKTVKREKTLGEFTYLCSVLELFSWPFVLFNYLRATYWKQQWLFQFNRNRNSN